MNIVAVRHEQCSEIRKSEYYIAPNGVKPDQFHEDVNAAQKEYLAAKAAFEKAERRPTFGLNLHGAVEAQSFPDSMTFGEIRAQLVENERLSKEWSKRRVDMVNGFQRYMKSRGYRHLWEAEDDEIPSATANWAHSHGQELDY